MGAIQNISVSKYRLFLQNIGCKCIRVKGGHEHWSRKDLTRPITFQTHIEPVPEFIIRQHLRHLGMSKDEFLKIIADL